MSTKTKKVKKVVKPKVSVSVEDVATSLADLMMEQDCAIEELQEIVYGLARRVASLEAIVATFPASRTYTGSWHG